MPAAGSTMRLVDPGTGTELLSVGPFTTTILTKLDFSFPDVRSTSSNRSGGSGTNDNTRWTGARAVTAEMVLPQGATTDDVHDLLVGLMDPGLRLWLYAQRPNWVEERRILVRGQTFTCPPGTVRVAQAGFAAPEGLLESATPQSVTLAVDGPTSGGMSVPLSVPLVIAGGLAAGATLVDVAGNFPALPTIDIYGPCTSPAVRCVDIDKQVVFTGLTIAPGDYLHVDLGRRQVLLNGTQNFYSKLDFGLSSWWSLPTGSGVQLSFSADATSAPCQAVVAWHPRWL